MKNALFILFTFGLVFSCTKREVIFEREVTEDFELALILNLNGKDCVYDAPTNTLKYSLAEDELTDFSPLTVFQDYSEIKFDGQLLSNNSINNFGTLSLNTPYNIEVKTLDEIEHLNLVFTKIPLVQIIAIDAIKNEPKILAKLFIHHPKISTPSDETYIGIELRGKSSIKFDKKSYGFKPLGSKDILNQTTMSFFNMSANSKWSLDALFVDKSKVRNKTSFEIWNSLSNTSIKSKYVEVFLNNKSLGIYRFSENYTQELLQMTDNSCLYVGVDNSAFTKFDRLPNRRPKSAFWGHWEQEFPNPSERIYWDDFYNFSKIIVEADNQLFINEIETHIDIDNLIDYYLFMSLCYGYDNVGKNWFFFKPDPSSKFEVLLWDLDATWGTNSRAEALEFTGMISNNLFDRLITLNPNGFKQKLKNRWFQP